MFFEVEFPRKLSYGMTGGNTFSTTVNKGFSGYEQRNKNWKSSLSKWTVSVHSQQGAEANGNVSFITDFDLLRDFNLVVTGQGDAFRLFEPTDYSLSLASGTGILAAPDGTNKIFQITKTYKIGGRAYIRNIKKPITPSVTDYLGNALSNTLTVYVNGVPQTLGSAYTVDYTTGLITFTTAPTLGQIVACDCQFHYPVRFNSDEFKAVIEDSNVLNGNAIVSTAIDLIEVRA
jgi:uncharacterized protein (TIGR02217 family)